MRQQMAVGGGGGTYEHEVPGSGAPGTAGAGVGSTADNRGGGGLGGPAGPGVLHNAVYQEGAGPHGVGHGLQNTGHGAQPTYGELQSFGGAQHPGQVPHHADTAPAYGVLQGARPHARPSQVSQMSLPELDEILADAEGYVAPTMDTLQDSAGGGSRSGSGNSSPSELGSTGSPNGVVPSTPPFSALLASGDVDAEAAAFPGAPGTDGHAGAAATTKGVKAEVCAPGQAMFVVQGALVAAHATHAAHTVPPTPYMDEPTSTFAAGMEAVEEAKEGVVALLNVRDQQGNTPVAWAVRGNSARSMAFLAQHNADATTPNLEGATPLHMGCGFMHHAMVETLLRLRVAPDPRDNEGDTPLMWAARTGDVATVNLLLLARADANAVNGNGASALVLAATQTHYGVVERLLRHEGVNADQPDRAGRTALHWACALGAAPCVTVLMRAAPVCAFAEAESGATPCHVAINDDNAGCVEAVVAQLSERQRLKLYVMVDAEGLNLMDAADAKMAKKSKAVLNFLVPDDLPSAGDGQGKATHGSGSGSGDGNAGQARGWPSNPMSPSSSAGAANGGDDRKARAKAKPSARCARQSGA